MNTKKFNTTLQKLNDLFGAVQRNPGEISAIERNLLRNYLMKLYDMSLEDFKKQQSGAKKDKKSKRIFQEKIKEPIMEAAADVREVEPEASEPIVDNSVESTSSDELIKELETQIDPELEILFEELEVKELSDKLRLSPLKNLNNGMGINEKIFTIQELFDGDQKAFDATLKDLNNLSDFNAAKEMLMHGVAAKYSWASNDNKKKAKNFIRFIRRRYS